MNEVAQESTVISEGPSVENSVQEESVTADNNQDTVVADDNQDTVSDWRSSLSDELKSVKALEDYKDVEALARSHVHLQSMIGKKAENMTPEDIKILDGLKGIPSSAEDYAIPEEADPDLSGWAQRSFLEAKLTKDQAKYLTDAYLEVEKNKREEYEANMLQMREEWRNEVKEEFGAAFDQRVKEASDAVRTYGGQELKDYLQQTGLGDHPAMVRAFAKIGKELVEDKFTTADASRKLGISPEEADQMIKTKMRDPEFKSILNSPVHPKHKEAVQELEDLYKLRHPE